MRVKIKINKKQEINIIIVWENSYIPYYLTIESTINNLHYVYAPSFKGKFEVIYKLDEVIVIYYNRKDIKKVIKEHYRIMKKLEMYAEKCHHLQLEIGLNIISGNSKQRDIYVRE